MTANTSLEGFPPEAIEYISELRKEAASYRVERNEFKAKFESAGDTLAEANKHVSEFNTLRDSHEKALADANTANEKYQRLSVAAKFGIPDEADRLKGTTPEELEADAQALAAKFGTKTPALARDAAAGAEKPGAPAADPISEAFRAKGLLL